MTAPWSLVLAFDRNYVLPAAVCLRSAQAHVVDPPESVFVVAEGLVAADEELLVRQFPSAKVHVVATNSPLTEFGNCADTAHATPAQFLKCLAPRILDNAADRMIYLDVDTLVLGDLGELARTEIGENIAGFVVDRFVTRNVIDPGDHPYYNAGMFVTDRSTWNAHGVTEKILKIIDAQADELEYGDQDALNKALRGHIAPLPQRWNYLLSEREKEDPTKEISHRTDEVSVLHFCGPVKPWRTPLGHPYLRELYDTYAGAVRA